MESKTKNELKETQMEAKDESKVEAKEDSLNKKDDDVMRKSVDLQLEKTRQLFESIGEKSKAAYKIMKEDYEMVKKKEENYKGMTKKLDDVHFTDVIKLNVGGQVFETGFKTLLKHQNSLFATQFSRSLKLKQKANEPFFIDRDGEYFKYVMSYMRNEKITAEMTEMKEKLIEEANFYGFPGLARMLSEEKTTKNSGEAVKEGAQDGGLIALQDHANETKMLLQDAMETLDAGQVALTDDLCLLEKSKENFLRMSERLNNVHFVDPILLDVGGHILKTNQGTLLKDPNSMLAAVFSQRFNLEKQQNGSYFIDRDGTHFRHVLNFLRVGSLERSVIEEIGDELLKEAEFYNIKGLSEMILKRTTVELRIEDKNFLTTAHTVKRDCGFAKRLFGDDSNNVRKDGAYVIEEDVKHLKEILMFLKNGMLPIDRILPIKSQLYLDAQALNVLTLQKYMTTFTQSRIIGGNGPYVAKLSEWISNDRKQILPLMLYSVEEDGCEEKNFANTCTNKEPTVIVAETENGCIFGGYTSVSRACNMTYDDPKSFVFSLKSLEWDEPFVMKAAQYGGISLRDYIGPWFLSTNNSSTCLQFPKDPRSSKCSYKYNANAFTPPKGVPTTNTCLAGEEYFVLKRMEVFAV